MLDPTSYPSGLSATFRCRSTSYAQAHAHLYARIRRRLMGAVTRHRRSGSHPIEESASARDSKSRRRRRP